ncbi:hypothetical protein BP6252_14092 [Coleophoma cylindrospora]|uniref:Uncharacterized protein n=1 Tax=Coleophoma cylindrospora TaxID=1849047 RepID=A0A3D8Q580_9HELO|nr:hypothetical protein BP6252_14092 [Coleophoma cylindrospora]
MVLATCPGFLPLATLLAGVATTIASDVLPTHGRVTYINNVPYYVGGIAVSKFQNGNRSIFESISLPDVDVFPLTIIQTGSKNFSLSEFNNVITNYSKDDVFQENFLSSIYFDYTGNGSAVIENIVSSAAIKKGNSIIMASSKYTGLSNPGLMTKLPNGPYFASPVTGNIFKAHRLYPDYNLAFMEPALSDEKGGYIPLAATTEGLMQRSVAVPSRLYFTPTAAKPLAGLRLGVKDIFDVKGLRTSGGDRAHYYLYGPSNVTGPAVQKLINKGAVFVGKMNTVQFANNDSPTADCVDVHCPFNPRGDGYQSPSGSSNGPAAGIASYDWLDISVGSDTGGSIRFPAGANGLYGGRPSTGAVSMDNVIPLCAGMDTAGAFARTAELWATVAHAWYDEFKGDYYSYPKTLYYPTDSFSNDSIGNSAASDVFESFMVQLEGFLGTSRTRLTLSDSWNQTRPTDAPSSLDDMLYLTYGVLVSVYQWLNFGATFFANYQAQNGGRNPFINPTPLVRWQWGVANGGEAAFNVAWENKTMFSDWWNGADGLGASNTTTCSKGLFIYPNSYGSTSAPTLPPFGFFNQYVAIYASTPDVVLPIGEVPYLSTITNRTEHLPVTVGINAAQGCDLMLANLVREMHQEGILKPVATGSRLFP